VIGGIKAGKAFVEFVLGDKKFKSELNSLSSRMRKFGSIGSAVSGPIVAGFAAAAVQFAKTGSALYDVTQRLTESAEEISSLQFVAEQAGSSGDVLEKSLFTMNKQLAEAANGSAAASDAFNKLGLNIAELQAMSPAERFRTIADAIAGLSDDTQRANVAQDLFGRGGRELLPVLMQGADGIRALQAEAHRLGVTLTDEDVVAADALDDALGQLWTQVKAVGLQVGAAIAGPLTDFVQWAGEILAWLIAFVREHPNLVQALAAIATAIAAASAVAVTLGIVMAIISAHPIIAALAAIAAGVAWVASWFSDATDSAKEFNQELDRTKIPGASMSVSQGRQARADQVQRDLQTALAGQMNGSSTVATAARDSSDIINEGIGDVVKWTRQTAEGVERLISVAQRSGLVAGAG
jgi:hypothetical protein